MFPKITCIKAVMFLIFSISIQSVGATSVIDLITPPKPHYTDRHPKVEWTFRFAKSLTMIEADILDIKRVPVWSLLAGKETLTAGDTQFIWGLSEKEDGHYPDGVYFLKLTGRDSDGVIHEFPGSEEFTPFGLELKDFDMNQQIIRFDNPKRGLVTVRIGNSTGRKKPLYASLINWEFMGAGQQVVRWKSDLFNNRFDLNQVPDLFVNASCYPLPEGCFNLSRGQKASDQQSELTMNERDLLFMHDANRYRYEIARGDFELSVDRKLIRNDDDTGYRLLFTVSASQAPFGWLETPGLVHEVKVYIDDNLVYLSKAEDFPFSDEVRFNVLTPGDHRLVINAWDHSNRFGYWTGVINSDDTH